MGTLRVTVKHRHLGR